MFHAENYKIAAYLPQYFIKKELLVQMKETHYYAMFLLMEVLFMYGTLFVTHLK
jgi:hypothetical protein